MTCLLSVYTTISSSFTHIVLYIRISFLYKAEYCPIVCVCHTLFTHSSVGEHLGCIQLLAIVNNAAMDVHMSVQVPVFNSFVYIARNGISGSYGNFTFNFLRYHHTVSTVAAVFYISTNSAQVFQFLHILTNACYFLFF